jgi:hypothetical protein
MHRYKTAWLMILLLAVPAHALRPPLMGGERFAPVTLSAGQGLRVVVANVRIPAAGAATDACPAVVRFYAADGTEIGADQDVSLAPGASISVSAGSATGLVRAIVSVANLTDPSALCALKSVMEVFNTSTGATLFLVPGQSCLGAAVCSSDLVKENSSQ